MSTSTSTTALPSASSKRLLHELQLYLQEDRSSSTSSILQHLGPISDARLDRWTAILKGPSATPFENGRWKVDIQIPEGYPMAPPKIRFVTTICHPNIHFKTGEICLDLLKDNWSPAYTIAQTLAALHHLLADPVPDSPLNVDVAALLRDGDRVGFESLVRYYTHEYRWVG